MMRSDDEVEEASASAASARASVVVDDPKAFQVRYRAANILERIESRNSPVQKRSNKKKLLKVGGFTLPSMSAVQQGLSNAAAAISNQIQEQLFADDDVAPASSSTATRTTTTTGGIGASSVTSPSSSPSPRLPSSSSKKRPRTTGRPSRAAAATKIGPTSFRHEEEDPSSNNDDSNGSGSGSSVDYNYYAEDPPCVVWVAIYRDDVRLVRSQAVGLPSEATDAARALSQVEEEAQPGFAQFPDAATTWLTSPRYRGLRFHVYENDDEDGCSTSSGVGVGVVDDDEDRQKQRQQVGKERDAKDRYEGRAGNAQLEKQSPSEKLSQQQPSPPPPPPSPEPRLRIWSFCCVYDSAVCDNKLHQINGFLYQLAKITEMPRIGKDPDWIEGEFDACAVTFGPILEHRRNEFLPASPPPPLAVTTTANRNSNVRTTTMEREISEALYGDYDGGNSDVDDDSTPHQRHEAEMARIKSSCDEVIAENRVALQRYRQRYAAWQAEQALLKKQQLANKIAMEKQLQASERLRKQQQLELEKAERATEAKKRAQQQQQQQQLKELEKAKRAAEAEEAKQRGPLHERQQANAVENVDGSVGRTDPVVSLAMSRSGDPSLEAELSRGAEENDDEEDIMTFDADDGDNNFDKIASGANNGTMIRSPLAEKEKNEETRGREKDADDQSSPTPAPSKGSSASMLQSIKDVIAKTIAAGGEEGIFEEGKAVERADDEVRMLEKMAEMNREVLVGLDKNPSTAPTAPIAKVEKEIISNTRALTSWFWNRSGLSATGNKSSSDSDTAVTVRPAGHTVTPPPPESFRQQPSQHVITTTTRDRRVRFVKVVLPTALLVIALLVAIASVFLEQQKLPPREFVLSKLGNYTKSVKVVWQDYAARSFATNVKASTKEGKKGKKKENRKKDGKDGKEKEGKRERKTREKKKDGNRRWHKHGTEPEVEESIVTWALKELRGYFH